MGLTGCHWKNDYQKFSYFHAWFRILGYPPTSRHKGNRTHFLPRFLCLYSKSVSKVISMIKYFSIFSEKRLLRMKRNCFEVTQHFGRTMENKSENIFYGKGKEFRHSDSETLIRPGFLMLQITWQTLARDHGVLRCPGLHQTPRIVTTWIRLARILTAD